MWRRAMLGLAVVSLVVCPPPQGAASGGEPPAAGRATATAPHGVIGEPARRIPVAFDVDVVVVGGTSGGVAAAVAAAQSGATVFVAAPRPYLGEDICATLRCWPLAGDNASHPLAKELLDPKTPYRPMRVKRALDRALLDAGVQFLFGCLATDVLADAAGAPAGILMANRAGRQAVRAKVIIDATDRAWVARAAGAAFLRYPAGPQHFRRCLVGGTPRTGEGIVPRPTGVKLAGDGADTPGLKNHYYYTPRGSAGTSYDLVEYTLSIPMPDGGFRSLAEAEQRARDMTFDPKQVEASEMLFQIPPDPMKGKSCLPGAWPGADKIELDVFRPAGFERFYVLGSCADVSRPAAETLTHPAVLIDVGARIGRAAAAEAKQVPVAGELRLLGAAPAPATTAEVRESLAGVRPGCRASATVPTAARGLRVLGSYDVVVVGGGTSGAPAAIGAARRGAKTLVVEYQHALGGVGTLGLVGNYYYGYKEGFTREVIAGVGSLGAILAEARMEWWRREIRKARGEIWLGCLGCGAVLEGQAVKGVVVATPEGRGVVLARVVIDATGNADIAAAAGAPCVTPGDDDLVVQGAGLPPRDLGMSRNSTDWTLSDDTDLVDLWHHLVYAKDRFGSAYDLAQLMDTRERRRIVGDFELSPLDIVNQRTYPDSIYLALSHFDSHGFLAHPLFWLEPALHKPMFKALVPYRSMVPRGLEGILVTGLGSSAQHDAIALVRMQADLQNQGYAAGVAAAMAASQDGRVRDVDIKALQKHLVDIGSLPESVLADRDSYPIPAAEIAKAVEAWIENKSDKDGVVPLAKILARPEVSIPLLKAACAKFSAGEEKTRAAQVLAFLGDNTGVPDLIARIEGQEGWDAGSPYTSWGWTRPSRLDSLVMALGHAGDRRAVAPILKKVAALETRGDFSHVRAAALALEMLGDPAAAAPLAALLDKKIQGTAMRGYAIRSLEDARRWSGLSARDSKSRHFALREILVARALFRCGDHQGTGRTILTEYAKDLRGPLARHALVVLDGRPTGRKP